MQADQTRRSGMGTRLAGTPIGDALIAQYDRETVGNLPPDCPGCVFRDLVIRHIRHDLDIARAQVEALKEKPHG